MPVHLVRMLFDILRYTVLYWAEDMFFFKDRLKPVFRADHWLQGFDQYARAMQGQDINDQKSTIKSYDLNGKRRLGFDVTKRGMFNVVGILPKAYQPQYRSAE